MKPTKKVAAKRPAKRRPAKKAYRSDSIIGKLLKLKYSINDAHSSGNYDDAYNDTKVDKSWVMNLISDVRTNELTNISKEDMLQCNSLWRKYEGK